jgi:hypothetical protein
MIENPKPLKVLNLLYQAACAVDRLHIHGYTHRNITPKSFWTTPIKKSWHNFVRFLIRSKQEEQFNTFFNEAKSLQQ